MINSFLKKATLLNFGLIIIIIRIYGYIMDKLNSKANLNSLFPKFDKSGYSFNEQILCGFKNLKFISNELKKNINDIKFNISDINEDKCLFFKKIEKCPIYILCENSFVDHKMNKNLFFENENFLIDNNDSIYWKIIFNENNFQNKQSMNFLYKIFSGYKSYIQIMLYNNKQFNNVNFLQEKLTFSYEKINNLFYFQSLLIKTYLQLNNDKIPLFNYNKIDKELISDFCEECIINVEKDILYLKNQIKYETMVIMEKIQDIISYILIDDSIFKNKCIFDIKAIETMFKILFNYEIYNEEIKQFKLLIKNIIENINLLFEIDSNLNEISVRYKKYSKITSTILIIISIFVLIFMNMKFLKNNDNKQKKFFPNKKYNIKKYQIYKKNLEKIKQIHNLNQPSSYDSFTKEEQALIDKLIKDNNTKE